MPNSRSRPKHPLMAALAAADAAIHADAPPAERVATALTILADGLATMLASSDASSRMRGGNVGNKQIMRRHGRFQDDRIAEIRQASRDASGSRRDQLPALYDRARSSTRAALRTQVKKLRIDRRTHKDAPGGEG